MKNKKGFTLIEVIISIAALSIICAVLLKLFVLAGDTNKRASDVQTAQVAVTSTVETLAGADSVEEALAALDLSVSDGHVSGRYSLLYNDYNVLLDISEAAGDYPGALYEIRVAAVADDKELAVIETAKYYGATEQ